MSQVEALPERKRITVENYNYSIDVDDTEDFAGALKLSTAERMHHILLDQVEDIGVRIAEVKESIKIHKKKIASAEATVKDFTDLLKIRSEESAVLQKELSAAHAAMENLLGNRSEIESKRGASEQRFAILTTELENNRRIISRLEKLVFENDYMQRKVNSLTIENDDLTKKSQLQTNRITELEKSIAEEALSSRLAHNKMVAKIEQEIAEERQRNQATIDEARKKLKAKILVLEAAIEDQKGSDAQRDIRRQEKNLKNLILKQDEQRAQLAQESRRIESLERQLAAAKEKSDKLLLEKAEAENRNYSKQREIGTLNAQIEAALYVSSKLSQEASKEAKLKDSVKAGTT